MRFNFNIYHTCQRAAIYKIPCHRPEGCLSALKVDPTVAEDGSYGVSKILDCAWDRQPTDIHHCRCLTLQSSWIFHNKQESHLVSLWVIVLFLNRSGLDQRRRNQQQLSETTIVWHAIQFSKLLRLQLLFAFPPSRTIIIMCASYDGQMVSSNHLPIFFFFFF